MNLFNKQERISNCVLFINIDRKNISLPVEIVHDPSSRSLGATDTNGMGYVYKFENEGILQFFVNNTNNPIDVIFINRRMQITHIERNLLMQGMGRGMLVTSKKKAMYVIEVPRGFTQRNNIDIGDNVRIIG